MLSKSFAAAVLASALLALPGNAQSPAELVSRAMSIDESGVNLDAAISIYRQVIGTPSDERVYAAYAQFRLGQIFLQKGALAAATQEFDKLARNYGDYSDLVSTLIAEDRPDIFHGGPSSNRPALRQAGPAQNGRYRHNLTGVELSLQGWTVRGAGGSSGGGEIMMLSDPGSGISASLWLKPDKLASADLPGRLRGALQQKILQRLTFNNYKVRPESITPRTIGGRQALSAVADYFENGEKMSEYLTWIYTETTRVLFFGRVRASELPSFQTSLDQLTAAAVVP